MCDCTYTYLVFSRVLGEIRLAGMYVWVGESLSVCVCVCVYMLCIFMCVTRMRGVCVCVCVGGWVEAQRCEGPAK